MHLPRFPRPLTGALLLKPLILAVACGTAMAWAADKPGDAPVVVGKIANTFEQLRVNSVADQLIRYLEKAVDWASGPASRVSLGSITPGVRTAVLAHPEVALAQEQRLTAAAATREAYAGFLPQVSSKLESGTRRYDAVNTPWNKTPAYDDPSKALTVTVSQLLYDFGGVNHKTEARTALEDAAAARSNSKRSEVTLRVMSAWLELFRAQQLVSVTQMNTLSRQQVLSFIEEREQLGGSSQSDVLRVRARLADAQSAAVAAQIRLTSAEAVYREMFSAPPPRQIALPEIAPIDLPKMAAPQAFAVSPLLSEAKAQTEAASREAKAAAAAMLPSFYLDLSARRRDMGGPGVPGLDWTAGVGVRHNLYAGGAEAARQRQAEQRVTESLLGQDNLLRQIERASSQALSDVNNSTAALNARKEAVQVAALALEAVREQFSFRRGTLLDLLRSQEELYIAGRDLVDGLVDHSLSRYRLLHLADELTPLFNLPAQTPVPRD
jgi:adhesin transport system outer membrane protein